MVTSFARWSVGGAFLEALAARDFDRLGECVEPDVRFRALLPPGPSEWKGAGALVEALSSWFGGADDFEVLDATVGEVGTRLHLRWRVRVRPAPFDMGEGWHVIEQQVYADAGERMETVDLLCSGFVAEEAVHRFDAGTMGCADGLAQEFRRRIRAVAPGEVLEVVATDPAAKEDLPPLARMMGHKVMSVEARDDGRLVIRVEAQ